jgi:predicted Zn-dependent peptidase
MKSTAKRIAPDDYILSVLSPKDRLEAAFKIAAEAFKKTTLTTKDVEKAVKIVRRRAYEKKR